MYTKRKKPALRPAGAARVEIVDHWHIRWPRVLDLIDRLGHREILHLDVDGWLSARQSVVVAFVDDEPTAHLCFHIQPMGGGKVEARFDAVGFRSKEASALLGKVLADAAKRHARKLRCARFQGLNRAMGVRK